MLNIRIIHIVLEKIFAYKIKTNKFKRDYYMLSNYYGYTKYATQEWMCIWGRILQSNNLIVYDELGKYSFPKMIHKTKLSSKSISRLSLLMKRNQQVRKLLELCGEKKLSLQYSCLGYCSPPKLNCCRSFMVLLWEPAVLLPEG